MGFESFRVELRGGKAPFAEADDVVHRLPHVQPDPFALLDSGSRCYTLADGDHVIELEVKDLPVRVSCRFTLCHPASVDSAFLEVVRELMARLGMGVIICDDVTPPQVRPFSLSEFSDFQNTARQYIALRRAEWQAAFGEQTLAARTHEVHERIILPHCQPVIQQPT